MTASTTDVAGDTPGAGVAVAVPLADLRAVCDSAGLIAAARKLLDAQVPGLATSTKRKKSSNSDTSFQ